MLKGKKNKKVSLNIKIEPDLDSKLKELRIRARKLGLIYNVSGEVVSFLGDSVERVENEISELEKKLDK